MGRTHAKEAGLGLDFTEDEKAALGLCLAPLGKETGGSGEILCLGIKAVQLALSLHYLSGTCMW